jgi:CRISPR type III-B/RAMP module RAMP protein Cmr6
VFFLTVAAGTPFTFRIGSRSGSTAHVTRAFQILEFGLDLLGLGAKTAAGYGTFLPPAR